MPEHKTIHGGEWVKARNMMNTRFKASRPCSICGTLRCEPVWYSLKTHLVKCSRCFDPGDGGRDG